MKKYWLALGLMMAAAPIVTAYAEPPAYKNFHVSVYARAYEVQKMSDPKWLKDHWDNITRDMHVDHIYLESHRDKILVDDKTLEVAKKFFQDRGVLVSGGITWTVNERNRFQTFCYSDPADRAWVQKVVEHTAKHFDEIILDDFFFTTCKSDVEIAAKGDQSWRDYRLKLMTEVARDLILKPAKAVNPKVKVIIKYPNWYEHFQGAGFNLETEPKLFDGIYTGTETRDPVTSAQHLQPYESYQIIRYFDNIAPGRNGGGWVDPGGMTATDRYAEQLADTLFAKAPQINLFDFRSMSRPITLADRGAWQGKGTSFDFDAAVKKYRQADGSLSGDLTIPTIAGATFSLVDPVIGQLGNPIGVKSYRPYHAWGESFLHNFIGTMGVPMDLEPTFPAEANTIFLAEDAKFDPDIVNKIKGQLKAGKTVIITTGLVKALQDKGLSDIVHLEVTGRKALVQDFLVGRGPVVHTDKPIIIPQLDYFTNDSWEDASAVDGWMGWPILHDADYSTGHLYVLTVPDNPANLYDLPANILNRIRQTMAQDMFVRLEGPSKVSLFAYDNNTFIVQSFRDEPVDIGLVAKAGFKKLQDLQTGEILNGTTLTADDDAQRRSGWAPSDAGKNEYKLTLKPHSFRAFKVLD